jgi:penicillin-binding protein 1A
MSRIARQRRRRRRHSGAGARLAFGTLGVLLVLGLGGLGAAVAYVVHYINKAPPLSRLHEQVPGGSSEIFAANGTRLGYIKSDVLRTPVSYADIPTYLKQATVAIEDQRFYQEGAIDVQGLLRAAVSDVFSGKALQGGSTITMQLVRNLYLSPKERTADTLQRKIFEATEAVHLQKAHTRSWILGEYLNSVPYGTVGGQTALGVQAAARVFFDKPVHDLDLAQCALLAGLPQAPSDYNPFEDLSAATTRRNEVLTKMEQLGYITPQQAQKAIGSPVVTKGSSFYTNRIENFFFDYVQEQLISAYGAGTALDGGLKVYTTLNLADQTAAKNSIDNVLNLPGDPSSAIVTENVHNGDILAMAESQSYDHSQFNLATQGRRQAGSTFKAIDLATALSEGVDPDTTYYLSHTLQDGWLPGYPTYNVHTFEGTSLNRSLNLVQATVTSDNTIYAQLAADLGEANITKMAYAMGVTEHLQSIASEALGGLKYGVSPLEMANVYATLADGGYRNKQTAITKVVFPGGKVDRHWGIPHRTKVLIDGATAEETKILAENIQSGTAAAANITCPAAAKTGTTSNLKDAWLDGYTPNLSTVVWMGYTPQDIPMTDVHGAPQQGGALPAVIWHDYMSSIVPSTNCAQWPAVTEPLVYKPFSGLYEKQGGGGPTAITSTTFAPAPTTKKQGNGPGGTSAPSGSTGATGSTGTGTGTGSSGSGTLTGTSTGSTGSATTSAPSNGGGNGNGSGAGTGTGTGTGAGAGSGTGAGPGGGTVTPGGGTVAGPGGGASAGGGHNPETGVPIG